MTRQHVRPVASLAPSLADLHPRLELLGDQLAQRRALFRQLGILDSAVRGSRVLEVSSGAGEGTVHTASLGPVRHDVFYGDPDNLGDLEARRVAGLLPASLRLLGGDVFDAPPTASFDFVIAENVLSGLGDPMKGLQHLARFVAPGGCLLITTHPIAGRLAELCRRLFVPQLADRVSSWHHDQLLSALADLWEPSLRQLPAAPFSDASWVLNQLVSPWAETSFFDVSSCVTGLAGEFDVHGMSPALLLDTRWLPAVSEFHDGGRNESVLAGYEWHRHLLVDHRLPVTTPAPSEASREALDAAAFRLYYACEAMLDGDRGELAAALEALAELRDLVAPITRVSIDACARALEAAEAGEDFDLGPVHGWWGRAPQHLCLVRRPAFAHDLSRATAWPQC